ncbi:TRAP transporter small permease subunit [uncultured Succinatimonas sp.]|uniref:TRAP transporter small permease n=2 Tax=uncultured Succinatimonas sp. TaxID=1262973 RepID=UPI0027D9795F|nr:TRAP transporter small permease subunit [uncultured Succinatimonas sp.]
MSTTKVRMFLDKLIFQICSLILVLMVLDVTWQVFSRYVLASPASFTDEGARFLMIWLGLLAGALLFGRGGHLAVTILSDSFKVYVSLLIFILIAGFAAFAMIYGGINLIQRTLIQPSPAMHIPMGYIYSILPISGVLIVMYISLNIIDLFGEVNKSKSDK